MLEQYATADCLSCIFNSYRDLETLPEPFRMQDKVTFRVTPSAYTDFILTLTPHSGVRLMTQLNVLQALASADSPRLYNCFLADMAFAILKEISFAEQYKRFATLILPTAQGASNVYVSSLRENYDYVNLVAMNEMRKILDNSGFWLPTEVSKRNIDLYKAAMVLYTISKAPTAVSKVNLLYDCPRENT